ASSAVLPASVLGVLSEVVLSVVCFVSERFVVPVVRSTGCLYVVAGGSGVAAADLTPVVVGRAAIATVRRSTLTTRLTSVTWRAAVRGAAWRGGGGGGATPISATGRVIAQAATSGRLRMVGSPPRARRGARARTCLAWLVSQSARSSGDSE